MPWINSKVLEHLLAASSRPSTPETSTKSSGPCVPLRPHLGRPDPRSSKLSPVQKAELQELLQHSAWAWVQDLWEAEFQAEVELLLTETDALEAARRQGRLQMARKMMNLPRRFLSPGHQEG